MRKTITAVLMAVFVVVGLTAVVSAASDADRVPAERLADASSKIKGRLADVHEEFLGRKVKCKTLACINRSLTRLGRAVNAILFELVNCEQVRDVTQYGDPNGSFGYEFTNTGIVNSTDTFPTSGLDFTTPGDTVSNRMLVYVC
jgi:hypothetical protein